MVNPAVDGYVQAVKFSPKGESAWCGEGKMKACLGARCVRRCG